MAEPAAAPIHCAAVTPSDTGTLPAGTMWLSFAQNAGVTLTLQITTLGGEVVSGIILPGGMWPIRATRVWNTGTTVTAIYAWWT
jgi:hypothetical protein